MTHLRDHPLLAGIVAVYLVLGILYATSTPAFEASDETVHYPMVAHIAETGKVAVKQPGIATRYEQEASQPPLYYLIGAVLTGWIDTSDLDEVRQLNPHAKIGIGDATDNQNMTLHTARDGLHGSLLAVAILRGFGLLLGAGTVIGTYALARIVWPQHPLAGPLAAALVAFNPMFVFIAASVNNDNLTIFLATWLMVTLLRTLTDGLTFRRQVVVAVLFALIALSKVSGLTFAPLIGLVLLIHGLRDAAWRAAFSTGFLMIGLWVPIAGWWYMRNLLLYGEITGTAMHVTIAGPRTIGLVTLVREEWFSFWTAYWGWFGAVNILAPDWAYVLFGAISVAAAAGAAAWFAQRMAHGAWADLLLPGLLLAQIGVVLGGVIAWSMRTFASQGRLLFPAIGAASALAAFGLVFWLPQRARFLGAGAVGAALAVTAAVIPFAVIRPAYTPPQTMVTLTREAQLLDAAWGPLALTAVEPDLAALEPGDRLPITVYWTLTEPTDENLSISYTVFGRDLAEIGKLDTYPGGGLLPTSSLQPGEIIMTTYHIRLAEDIAAPTAARVQIRVGQLGQDGFTFLPGEPVMVTAGAVYAEDCETQPPDDPSATLFDFAHLTADPVDVQAAPGETLTIPLTFFPYNRPEEDLTVFVHLLDGAGHIAAQNDRPPLHGDYPTSLWLRPCPFTDAFERTLPQ
ncbi:MAG: DUF2142 domain-containing protein [Anaerolineae bacterium]